MKSVSLAALFALLGGALASACAHPHSGKPERLRAPEEREAKEDEGEGEEDGAGEEEEASACRTNFFAPPFEGRRRGRHARRLARKADGILLDAEEAEGEKRKSLAIEAMSKLENALEKDPYGPEPTYKFAVAYALVGHKSCALAFLERLGRLQTHPDVEREAYRAVQRALRDPAFESFRKEADDALGE